MKGIINNADIRFNYFVKDNTPVCGVRFDDAKYIALHIVPRGNISAKLYIYYGENVPEFIKT